MKRYYLQNPVTHSLEEVSRETLLAYVGTEKSNPYIIKLYTNQITTAEVPEEIRDEVVACVNARIQRFGEYRKEG